MGSLSGGFADRFQPARHAKLEICFTHEEAHLRLLKESCYRFFNWKKKMDAERRS